MIACILLSAGLSSRFGSPKALIKLDDKTLIDHLQTMLVDSQVAQIIIVLGAGVNKIKPFILKHKKIQFVYNKDYNFGQTSSFKAGLKKVSSATNGIMLLPVDYPFIKSETINSIINKFGEMSSPVFLIPSFDGKKGHPLFFSSDFKNEFLKLENTVGLNSVAKTHQNQVCVLPVDDPGVISTFNTDEELTKLKHDFGRNP